MQNHVALLSLYYITSILEWELKKKIKQNSCCECNLQKTECQTEEGIIINSIFAVLSPL